MSQAIFCVETALAAMMRSPSFSLPSSSMTTMNSPRPNASMASSMESNAKASRRGTFGTSCGREDDASAGMSGKSVGWWVPFILETGLEGVVVVVEGVLADDSETARATGAMYARAENEEQTEGRCW